MRAQIRTVLRICRRPMFHQSRTYSIGIGEPEIRVFVPDCQMGYSTSRTCDIGVSLYSCISYQSIAYLVDEAVHAL